MIEELDDISYNYYTLNQVFIEDDEKKLTNKIDNILSEEEIDIAIVTNFTNSIVENEL